MKRFLIVRLVNEQKICCLRRAETKEQAIAEFDKEIIIGVIEL